MTVATKKNAKPATNNIARLIHNLYDCSQVLLKKWLRSIWNTKQNVVWQTSLDSLAEGFPNGTCTISFSYNYSQEWKTAKRWRICVRASDFGNNGNAKHNMEVTGATRFVPKVHLDGAMIRARHPLYDLGNCSARKGIASETAGLSCIHWCTLHQLVDHTFSGTKAKALPLL